MAGKKASKKHRSLGSSKAATAVHLRDQDGKNHLVGIGNLRVLLVPDGRHYVAQGLEIDYCAQGASIEEAKTNFEEGLERTIDHNLRLHGSIKHLLNPAPKELWAEVVDGWRCELYSQLSSHHVERLPYDSISWFVPKEAGTLVACA